jgi:MFS-type transporter involved in bile tolerance (Atg22 family)
MTPITFILVAFILALLVMSFAFAGGAVPVALPIAALLIAAILGGNYARRRRLLASESSPRYDLSAGDPSTLYTGDPHPDA